jgi:hypothetical protein
VVVGLLLAHQQIVLDLEEVVMAKEEELLVVGRLVVKVVVNS